MRTRTHFDVIVVGAGPGGSQAARQLAARGHSVLLLDSTEEIGGKLCTGIVSVDCAEQFGVPYQLVWHESRRMLVFPPAGDPIEVRRRDVHALVIDRAAFIRSIAEDAARRGAHVRLGRRVVDLSVRDDRVDVVAASGAGTETFTSEALVVASGFRTGLARKVGLDVPRASAYAAQALVTGLENADTHVFARRFVPSSFFGWLVPTRDGEAFLGLLGRERPLGPFRRFVEGLRAGGYSFDLAEPPRVWGVPLRASRRSYAERCLLVGDAAGQVKPTTGGGIFFSLRSGDMAAKVISEGLNRGEVRASSLAAYEHMWKAEFGKEIRLGYLARLFYQNIGDDDLERMLRGAEASGILDGDLSFDRHSEIFTRAMRSKLFMPLLRSIPRVAARVGGVPL